MSKKAKLSDLIADNKNFNKGTEYGQSLIEKSLRKFGAGRSILIDKNNRIIAGNKTVENAAAIGLDDLQIVESDGTKIIAVKRTDIDLDSKAGRELALADNATSKANIDWDIETTFEVANEFGFDAGEWGVEDSTKEIEAVEDDFNETPPEIPITVLGDLYEIGEHRLLCGDSTDSDQVAKLMNGSKADMVFTDPPYGVSYTGGHNEKKRKGIENDTLQGGDLTNLFRDSLLNADLFSKDHSAFYIWYANGKAVETFSSFSELNLEVRAVICWYKIKSGLGAFMSQYIPNYEPCIYAFKKGKTCQWFGETDEKTVWELKKESRNDYHPTQKPVELPERAIKNSSKLSDIIYDCFLGSGSTMVASHQLKRKCYGMELDPKYCDVIVRRMLKLDPTLTVKRNGVDCKDDFLETAN
jgi:DNA modification methylase